MKGDNMGAEVVHIKPKTRRHTYKRHEITIKFDPDTHEWNWKVKHSYPSYFNGVSSTQEEALKEAKKIVDRIEET